MLSLTQRAPAPCFIFIPSRQAIQRLGHICTGNMFRRSNTLRGAFSAWTSSSWSQSSSSVVPSFPAVLLSGVIDDRHRYHLALPRANWFQEQYLRRRLSLSSNWITRIPSKRSCCKLRKQGSSMVTNRPDSFNLAIAFSALLCVGQPLEHLQVCSHTSGTRSQLSFFLTSAAGSSPWKWRRQPKGQPSEI